MDNVLILENQLIFISLAILSFFVILCFILCMINMNKLSKTSDILENENLSNEIKEYFEKVEALSKEISISSEGELLKELQKLKNQNDLSLSKTSIINFDAYDDVTGKFSFSVAILNNLNDGIILTSLYGRNSCNTYIRQIKNGICQSFLIQEEKIVLERAIKMNNINV